MTLRSRQLEQNKGEGGYSPRVEADISVENNNLNLPRGPRDSPSIQLARTVHQLEVRLRVMEHESHLKDAELARMRQMAQTPRSVGGSLTNQQGTPQRDGTSGALSIANVLRNTPVHRTPPCLDQSTPGSGRNTHSGRPQPQHLAIVSPPRVTRVTSAGYLADDNLLAPSRRVVPQPTPMPRIKTRGDMKYNGKTSFDQYFKKFELIAACNRWTDEEKFGNLLQNLEGDAESEALESDAMTYIGLCRVLGEAFTEESFSILLTDMSGRKQREGESVDEYSRALKRMGQRIFQGDSTRARDKGISLSFLPGLRDETMRQKVAEKGPKNLTDMIEAAKLVEAGEEVVKPVPKPRKSSDKSAAKAVTKDTCKATSAPTSNFTELKEELEKVKAELERQRQRGGKGRGRGRQAPDERRPVICYWCRQPGHIARDCAERRREQSQAHQGSTGPGNSNGTTWRGTGSAQPSAAPTSQ